MSVDNFDLPSSPTHNSGKSVTSKSRQRTYSVVEYRYWKNAPKRFCQKAVRSFWFWIAVALFALLEPCLCSQPLTVANLAAQAVVLAISTFLYFVQIIGVATTEWDRIKAVQALGQFGSMISMSKGESSGKFMVVKLFLFFTAEGEFLVEGAMILAGWILIFWHPGLAILRCFRVFRLLWFYEVTVFKATVRKWFSPILGEGFVSRGFKVLKFAIKALSALGDEIFRLTPETRGGLLLMMMIFYSAFVLGAALYTETEGAGPNCESIGMCTYTLMRLTFFDGNGFDFAYFLVGGYKILFFIVMLYMCITSFGIINGLVGIFGTLFATASAQAFEEEDGDGRYGKIEDDDDNDYGDDDLSSEFDNVQTYPGGNLEEGEGGDNNKQHDTDNNGHNNDDIDADNGDERVPLEKFSDAQKKSASDLMAAVEGKAPPMTEQQIESHLKDILGKKNVSNYAVQEFQQMQEKNSPRLSPRAGPPSHPHDKSGLNIRAVPFSPANLGPNTASTANNRSAGKNMFFRDIAKAALQNKRDTRVSEQGDIDLYSAHPGRQMDSPLTPGEVKSKPVAGLFGAPLAKKASSRYMMTGAGEVGGRHGGGSHDLRLLTTHVAQMQQKMDQQHELIQTMLQHIVSLQKELAVVSKNTSSSGDTSKGDNNSGGNHHPIGINNSNSGNHVHVSPGRVSRPSSAVPKVVQVQPVRSVPSAQPAATTENERKSSEVEESVGIFNDDHDD